MATFPPFIEGFLCLAHEIRTMIWEGVQCWCVGSLFIMSETVWKAETGSDFRQRLTSNPQEIRVRRGSPSRNRQLPPSVIWNHELENQPCVSLAHGDSYPCESIVLAAQMSVPRISKEPSLFPFCVQKEAKFKVTRHTHTHSVLTESTPANKSKASCKSSRFISHQKDIFWRKLWE